MAIVEQYSVRQKKSIQLTANLGCVNVAAGCNKNQSKNTSQFEKDLECVV
jgi:hypothetical protein